MRFLLFALPLLLLAGLVAIFASTMNRDPSLVRSVLIDKPAPSFTLEAVPDLGVPGFATENLTGGVTVVNVFASWCIPCRAEHPLLTSLTPPKMPAPFWPNWAIPMMRSAPTATGASRSTGVSMACPKPLWSTRKG
ncbi:MAG: DsbE family thiol:disulfide interchange protein [Devosia sp.]|nr:DsbE family thiol:disulfide interchange protein [Devosia sp.]